MAQTYRPMQLHAGTVDRLNSFKERLGTQVFMNPTALGLSACIGVLLDIEQFIIDHQCVPSFDNIKAIANKYPQRGRKRVSKPGLAAITVDRGHDLSKFGPGVRACNVCHIRFADDEEIFAQCQGPDSHSGEPGSTVQP